MGNRVSCQSFRAMPEHGCSLFLVSIFLVSVEKCVCKIKSFVAAHGLSTVSCCDKMVDLSNKSVVVAEAVTSGRTSASRRRS
jgi:hypothetical protein